MEGQRTKNALLFVIALCLVLIVLRLYSSGDFVKAAQAGQGDPRVIYGCWYRTPAAESCVPSPVRLTSNGAVVVATDAK
jgi:hypothetical protein